MGKATTTTTERRGGKRDTHNTGSEAAMSLQHGGPALAAELQARARTNAIGDVADEIRNRTRLNGGVKPKEVGVSAALYQKFANEAAALLAEDQAGLAHFSAFWGWSYDGVRIFSADGFE